MSQPGAKTGPRGDFDCVLYGGLRSTRAVCDSATVENCGQRKAAQRQRSRTKAAEGDHKAQAWGEATTRAIGSSAPGGRLAGIQKRSETG